MIPRIAWRNLWRNKTRTGIVISAIAFSYGLMLFLFGIADYGYQEMGEATVEVVGGHILVHGEGYWDFPTGGQVVSGAADRRQELEQLPQVEAVSERVIAFGLLGTADATEAAQVMGVRRDDELRFTDVEDRLIEGGFLEGGRDSPIVIGREMAETLNVEIGDRVVLTGSDLDGEVIRGLFFVDGLYDGGPGGADEGRAYVMLEDFQGLLGYGETVTQLGVRLYDEGARHQVARVMRDSFEGQELEILTWDEAVPELVALIEFDQAFSYIYVLIIMIIVVLGITNTLLMAVMERIREIGLFSALGLTPRRIGLMVIIETAMVTLVAMIIGFGLGFAGHLWMVEYGIDLSEVMDLDIEFSGVTMDMFVIHSYLDPTRWIVGTLVIFLFICASAIYPAWKASRLAPAEAMRFYE